MQRIEPHRQEVSIEDYHNRRASGPWISHSALRYAWCEMPDGEWIWTPHTFKQYLKGRMKTFPTRDQDIGTIFHSLCEGVDPKIIVCPVDRRGTIEWKNWVKEKAKELELTVEQLEAEYKILKEKDDNKIGEMYKSLLANKIVQEMMEDKRVAKEGTVRWEDPEHGIKLQARPDLETENFVLDYKTSADPVEWLKNAPDHGYHRQGRMQLDGVKAVTGKDKILRHIVIGKSPPFDTIVYQLPPNALALGAAQLSQIYSNIKSWMDFDSFDSPWNSRVVTTDFPTWYYKNRIF